VNGRYHWDKQLPDGVADLFYVEAARKRAAEERLRQVFFSYGYTEVIPPTFEHYESLATEAGAQLQEEMYRFFSREGRTLALRADMTIPIARIVGTKLYDQPLPLRLCYYAANVFRHEEPQAGRRHEFTQAGVELIGAVGEQADAEVMVLLVEALQKLGLRDFRISLGQAAFFKALVREAPVPAETMALLRQAIDAKDDITLRRLVAELELPLGVAALFATLPQLQGGAEVLDSAERLCLEPTARAAVRNLRRVHQLLDAAGVADHVQFDLAQVRGMDYYTGILFQVFVPGLGFPICSGGRYDDLIAHFGADLPAVGFAMGVERLLLALEAQRVSLPVDIAPHVIISGQPWAESVRLAAAARRSGLRAELELTGRSEDDLIRYAVAKEARYLLSSAGAGRWRVWQKGAERICTLDDLLQEMMHWTV